MRSSALLTICGALLLAVAISLPSIASDNLNYQGRLTDASGTAVPDASYSLTFRIYNVASGGSPLWTETHPAVATSGGLFTVLLGSIAPLDLASLGNDVLYWEIVVGVSTTPLAPRTPLTSSPRSAVAGRVMGDLETAPGVLTIKRSDGDSTMSIRSFDGGISMRMFDPQPEPPGKAVIELSSTPTSGSSFRMFDPQPEPPGISIEMLSGTSIGNSQSGIEGSSAITGPSFRMFDPQPEPPGKLFELIANAGSGPTMSFFNQAGQVMGVEPTPWNTGFSLKLFDPQPEPPGKMLELGTSFGSSGASALEGVGDTAWFKTYGLSSLGGLQEYINLYSTDMDAELRLGQGAPIGSSAQYLCAKSNGLESKIELVGPMGAAPAPPIKLTSMNGAARIGIGTSTPTQALHVVGNICYTGTIGACSDEKFKVDIEQVHNALDMVSVLNGVRYKWNAKAYPEYQFSEGTQLGFIAQEVQEIVPEVVTQQADGSLSVDYGRLTPILLEAIKELKSQNERLTKRIEALEKR